ncbi:MAG TPA: tetratricopeptide repeat protein [Anaeromyxobacteraceae bacterium]|nr:tetratricopeptide repeat protein [Anaeromyxobacteraceae bacterium]
MRGGRPLAAALALALAACSSAESRLEQANELRHQGKPREALDGYRDLLGDLGDGTVPKWETGVRLRALKYAADVSYLELGDFPGAISYYRRIVSLYPGTDDAFRARAAIGDIYVSRLGDHVAGIAQYSAIAQSDWKEAPRYQLEVVRQYLELKNYEQTRTEARILRDRWPRSGEADEAQLLTAQAWALEKRPDEALSAFQAAWERHPRPEIAALALEGAGHIQAQAGRFDKAIELYTEALPSHPNPEALRTSIEKVRERREAAKTVTPGDRAAVFDHKTRSRTKEVQ